MQLLQASKMTRIRRVALAGVRHSSTNKELSLLTDQSTGRPNQSPYCLRTQQERLPSHHSHTRCNTPSRSPRSHQDPMCRLRLGFYARPSIARPRRSRLDSSDVSHQPSASPHRSRHRRGSQIFHPCRIHRQLARRRSSSAADDGVGGSCTEVLGLEEDQISWFVFNCGALLEFVLDHPVILNFAQRSATLWDGGEGAISNSNIPLIARTVSAVLKDPDRVADHRLKVHGGTISQNRALEIAKQASDGAWTVEERDSQAAYAASMASLNDGAALPPEQLMAAMLIAYNSASFGKLCDGHFESVYKAPDNT
jgi:hypothetical protein